jgi:hypothetical protein
VRADAGLAVPAPYDFLEEQENVRYVIGFITNNRLRSRTAPLARQAEAKFQVTGEKQRPFTAFAYQADSWDRSRRIIAKVEYTAQGLNQRFVVTNLVRNPQFVYDDIYVLRGEVENRIKELKLEIKADRLSCCRFLANQWQPKCTLVSRPPSFTRASPKSKVPPSAPNSPASSGSSRKERYAFINRRID